MKHAFHKQLLINNVTYSILLCAITIVRKLSNYQICLRQGNYSLEQLYFWVYSGTLVTVSVSVSLSEMVPANTKFGKIRSTVVFTAKTALQPRKKMFCYVDHTPANTVYFILLCLDTLLNSKIN